MELRVEEITKNFGDKCAVDHISLELGAGIYGFLGANGAGKSTLVNMIVGNLEPDNGSILCDGKDIKELNELYREQIGFMPQQQEMYDFFTGYRFLSYIAKLKGLDEKYGYKTNRNSGIVNWMCICGDAINNNQEKRRQIIKKSLYRLFFYCGPPLYRCLHSEIVFVYAINVFFINHI